MKKTKQQKIDRHTTLSCISVSESNMEDKQKNTIINVLKRNGWGVVVEEERYRFINFQEQTESDVLKIMDKLDCHVDGWCVYNLSFPSVEDAQKLVNSAEWE